MMDFSKHFGETIIDVSLGDVKKTWKEGLLMKKICFTARTSEGNQTYKFGPMARAVAILVQAAGAHC